LIQYNKEKLIAVPVQHEKLFVMGLLVKKDFTFDLEEVLYLKNLLLDKPLLTEPKD
jgi:hypothetical protein